MSRKITSKQLDVIFGQSKWNTSGATLPANGTPKDVTSFFTGKVPGGTGTQEGVFTSSPQNRVQIRLASTGKHIVDPASDLQIYARLTESTGTWNLTFYTIPGGVETAFDFSGHPDASAGFEFRWSETTQLANIDPLATVGNGDSIDEAHLNVSITSHTHVTDVITVTSNGQTVFSSALSQTPNVNANSELLVNGVTYLTSNGDYTISGLDLTWTNTEFSLETTDEVVIRYQSEVSL